MNQWDVLGDPVRRRLVELLADGSRTAGELTASATGEFGISQPAVSNHLRVLREAGVAVDLREGSRRRYSLVPGGLDEAAAWIARVAARGSGLRGSATRPPDGAATSDPITGMRVSIGGRTRSSLLAELAQAGVELNEHAERLLETEAFDAERPPSAVLIVERTVAELGLSEGAALSEVFAAAIAHGLVLLPLDAGPYLRLAMMSQEASGDPRMSCGTAPDGALTIASPPLDDDEFPKGFYLRVVDGVPWLRGYRCDDEHRWSPGDRFLFALPGG